MGNEPFDYNAVLDMLYLCGCVLTGETPDKERVNHMDLAPLYAISKFHSLTALVCEGLERGGCEATAETEKVLTAFRTARERSVRKNLMFDIERGKILSYLEENGIWYMPLKGVVLKDLYPKMGLRQMADNDILFDANARERVRDYFVSQGYTVKAYEHGNHDVYQKEPFYNYEMHVALFSDKRPDMQAYYANVKERLVPCENTRYGFRFTTEDFYCYFLAHAYKHYDNAGIGMRFLLDVFVYWKAYGETMDKAYLEQTFSTLGITAFAHMSQALGCAIFADIQHFDIEALPESQKETLLLSLSSGIYGTITQSTEKGIARHGGSKGKYLLWRLFPGTEILQVYHPVFRHKLLLPAGWVYRGVRILSGKRGEQAATELATIVKAGKK